MRALFDEQLSESLLADLGDLCPGATDVRALGIGGAADELIWRKAIELGCVLITKDEDFHRLSVLRGAPPKVVWLRLGNCTTRDVERLLRLSWPRLEAFAEDPVAALMELG